MKKIIQFFQSPLFLPVAIVFALYLYWFLTIPMNESFLTGLILFAIYFSGTIFVRLSEKHWGLSQLVFLILLPTSIYVAILEFWAHMWITDDIGIHSHLIGLIIAIVLLAIHAIVTIRDRVNLNKTVIMSLLLFVVSLPYFVLNFGYFVVYYSSTEIIEKAQFGQYTYLIVAENDGDFHGYETFYKCHKWGFTCEGLYSSYSPTIGWKIIIDDQKKEVSLFDEITLGLMYTDGENPRAYTGDGGILRDHLYNLSEKCNNLNNNKGYYACESYTYIPYKCNMKSVLCESIPIQYTEDNYGYYYWVENESKNEISLYDENDALIFMYGAHPLCYVDGCKILE
jgi:hypothetical protein